MLGEQGCLYGRGRGYCANILPAPTEAMNMHKLSIVIAAAAIAVGGYPVLADQSMPAAVTVPIAAQNGSGQTGVATLTATSDNKTKVDISMNGEPSGANEPAHIHP